MSGSGPAPARGGGTAAGAENKQFFCVALKKLYSLYAGFIPPFMLVLYAMALFWALY